MGKGHISLCVNIGLYALFPSMASIAKKIILKINYIRVRAYTVYIALNVTVYIALNICRRVQERLTRVEAELK